MNQKKTFEKLMKKDRTPLFHLTNVLLWKRLSRQIIICITILNLKLLQIENYEFRG